MIQVFKTYIWATESVLRLLRRVVIGWKSDLATFKIIYENENKCYAK
jgi:hypothetical protein